MSEYKLSVLSPHMVEKRHVNLFNNTYAEWKKNFSVVVEDKGGKLDPDDFFRSDYVAIVTNNTQIVCFCLLTIFDLNLQSSREHHYIQALSDTTIQKLKNDNMTKLISLEYLCVLPEWRKHNSQIIWAEIMLGVGNLLMDESITDGLIGMPRIDRKVDEVLLRLDAFPIQEPVSKMGYPCAILVFNKKRNRVFKNQITNKLVHELWSEKDTSHIDTFNLPIRISA